MSQNNQLTRQQQVEALEKDWATNPRWKGIKRGYTAEDVVRLRGSFDIEHTVARRGAEKLWDLVNNEPYVNCLGALTGGQAMQQVKAGVKAIYLSGWQVAADNNTYASMYPDQSLYPVDSVPKVVEITPDNKYLLVANWCSYTVSIISIEQNKVIKTVKISNKMEFTLSINSTIGL